MPEELQTMVGDFVLAQEDDSLPTCPIRFTDRDAAGGWAVEMPETCPAPYPTADQIAYAIPSGTPRPRASESAKNDAT